MTTVIAQRSIRLLGKTSAELNRQSAATGEIFYDNTAQTLRLYNGSTVGGSLLATVSALNSLIPSQTDNSGKFLTTTGTALSWGTITPTPVATRTSTGTITGLVGNEIALGINAGKTSQGAYAVALGLSAGEVSQATLAVAVGSTSGLTNQQMAAVAIGYQAGQTTQGASAIAIGRAAGKTSQAANSIVINATGSTLNNTTADSLVIAPVRSATATANVLYYNTTTKEVTYAALPLEIPTQTGNSGKYLTTNGTTVSWASAGGGGTTTNALTFGTGLSLNGGTTFDGSVAKTVSLAPSGVTAQSIGSSTSIPVFTVDTYGRITSVTNAAVNTNASNSFANIYANAGGTLSSPMSGGSSVGLSASSSSDTLYLLAGTNVTITANSSSKGIMISSTGGAAAGITWTTNTSPSGTITVTNPTGYNTSGSIMVIVVVGLSVSSSSASSGSGSFSTAMSVGQNTRVFYTYTTSSLGATTTISNITGYAMAYAYIGSGPSIATSSTSTSSTSTSLSNPSPVYGTPRIIAVSQSSSLNLATLAGPASGGGPTWATGSGFVHPNDSNLSAAVWVGTGSWTTMATPTITSNPSFMSWYLTGISIG